MSVPPEAGAAPYSAVDVDDRHEFGRMRDEVDSLLHWLSEAERRWSKWLAPVSPAHRASARNLVHFWAIRQHDLSDLQRRLTRYGLSSLGRSEPHVQSTLMLIRAALTAMLEDEWRSPGKPAVSIDEGRELLRYRTDELLGKSPQHRHTRIMVTLPSAAATDPDLVAGLVQRGMDVARINCAHDDADAWRAMARHVTQAAVAAGRTCLIAMDLAGPKLRTGPLQPGPPVVKLRTVKNAFGDVVTPTRAWLTAAEDPAPAPAGIPTIRVPGPWLRRRHDGDLLRLRDIRGARRKLRLDGDATGGFIVIARKTTYLATGTTLHVDGVDDPVEVGELPPVQRSLLLQPGDVLHLTRDTTPAPVDNAGGNPRIGCILPEVFDHARVGQPVHFDDGAIGGTIVSADPDVLGVRIDWPSHGILKLKGGKGINLPDTILPIPALTDKDIIDLATVVELADIVQFSFVHSPSDIEQLLHELDRLGAESLDIVLKIETRQAFEQLPQLALTAMQRGGVAVMIARGDLAVESGYERLAELQEEILWLCEAAHLPVIWATQVLEQLAKSGLPSRAEISDAAMAQRAECVMLNKGPYINEAVEVIDNILQRMARHQHKKYALLRTLRSWQP